MPLELELELDDPHPVQSLAPIADPIALDPSLDSAFDEPFEGAQEPLEPDLPAHFFATGGKVSSGNSEAPKPPAQVAIKKPSPLSPPVKSDPLPLSALAVDRKPAKRLDAELPEIGAILDKYRIEELLGTGGFAVVYRATHLLLNMPVAIKLLRPKVIKKDPRLAALLCEEARFAARINHPNVVRVFDVTHNSQITYVVMEYIDGPTLSELIERERRLSIDAMLAIGINVAKGLEAGLAQHLIHRDIKPANILLAKGAPEVSNPARMADGTSMSAKIVDLGLAYASTDQEPVVTAEDPQRRVPIIGTPGYMAPEQQIDPKRVDFRADVYSLGVTLYQAVLGHPPFPTRDAAKCMAMHRSDPVPAPDKTLPGFPADVSKMLLQMLSKQPAARQGSYTELIAEMSSLRQATPPTARGR